MLVFRVAFIAGFALFLALIIRWLATYSSESRNANSGPATSPWGSLIGLWVSRDTTVSAYARSVQECAQENDRHAARLTEHLTAPEESEWTQTQTEARTEVPKPL